MNGGVAAFFINDKFKVTPWLTLIAGLRETAFSSTISENATDPRLGAAIRIPRLNWVFRGFYGLLLPGSAAFNPNHSAANSGRRSELCLRFAAR